MTSKTMKSKVISKSHINIIEIIAQKKEIIIIEVVEGVIEEEDIKGEEVNTLMIKIATMMKTTEVEAAEEVAEVEVEAVEAIEVEGEEEEVATSFLTKMMEMKTIISQTTTNQTHSLLLQGINSQKVYIMMNFFLQKLDVKTKLKMKRNMNLEKSSGNM